MDYSMHVFPGRIRIRASVLKKNYREMFSLSQCVTSLQGVTRVKTNQTVGSLQIHFDKNTISSQLILTALARQGFVPWMKPRTK